ncbi:phage portal protein [Atlantibacter sp. RC6]|uniref:phage portal protein n=1 Tax=Atlantibacter sp. RC6 TaxID=2587036 RepID=UPI001606434C|nr:phage portal protein [Atlantibacter sp. RC6]MBB3320660.1 lambda family phage portal protein [Atlantibacter sp. RC6]
MFNFINRFRKKSNKSILHPDTPKQHRQFRKALSRIVSPVGTGFFKRALGINTNRISGSSSDGITAPINRAIGAYQQQQVMFQARDLVVNNPLAANYIRVVTDGVVGSKGINPTVSLVNRKGELNIALNKRISDEWLKFAENPQRFSLNKKFTFKQFLREVSKARIIDGETFIRIHRFEEGIRVEIIPSERVDRNLTKQGEEPDTVIYQGIEFDIDTNEVVAYWLRDFDILTQTYSGTSQRIPAEEILHHFDGVLPDSYRGVTDFLASMNLMNHLNDFTFASLVQKQITAASMTFLERDKSQDSLLDDDEGEHQEITQEMSPGLIMELPAGYSAKSVTANSNGDSYESFAEATIEQIAAGLGVYSNALLNSTKNVNFSSARFGQLQTNARFAILRDKLKEQVIIPLFEEFLRCCIDDDVLPLTQKAVDDVIFNTTFSGEGMKSVDPIKEYQAYEVAVRNKFMSRHEAIIAIGGDPQKVDEEIDADTHTLTPEDIPPENDSLNNDVIQQ